MEEIFKSRVRETLGNFKGYRFPSRKDLISCLGRKESLMSSFCWAGTHQGSSYWYERYNKGLCSESKQILMYCIEEDYIDDENIWL